MKLPILRRRAADHARCIEGKATGQRRRYGEREGSGRNAEEHRRVVTNRCPAVVMGYGCRVGKRGYRQMEKGGRRNGNRFLVPRFHPREKDTVVACIGEELDLDGVIANSIERARCGHLGCHAVTTPKTHHDFTVQSETSPVAALKLESVRARNVNVEEARPHHVEAREHVLRNPVPNHPCR